MFQIRVDIQNRDSFKKKTDKLKLSKTLLDRIGSQFVVFVNRQFERGTDPFNKPWIPLAGSTVRKKGNNRILIDTGRLQNSVSYKIDAKNSVTLDINRRYPSGYNAAVHQLGLGHNPKRQILPDAELPPVWKGAVTRLVNLYFK